MEFYKIKIISAIFNHFITGFSGGVVKYCKDEGER